MDPSKLFTPALRHELKFRGIDFTSEKKAVRDLRNALRNEAKEPTERPQPPEFDAPEARVQYFEKEAMLISNLMGETMEMSTLGNFPKSESIKAQVYSMICHIEGRLAFVKMADLEDEGMKQILITTREMARDLRQKYFADYPVYVQYKQKAEGAVGGEPNPTDDVESFTEEDARELKEMMTRARELEAKRDRMMESEISYELVNDADEEESSDSEFEDAESSDDEEQPQPKEDKRKKKNRGDGNSRSPSGQKEQEPINQPNNNAGNQPHVFPGEMGFNSTWSQQRSSLGRSFTLPVHKWKLEFNGTMDGTVIAFIKDVENMARAQMTSTQELCRNIHLLLKGKAAEWYRAYGYNAQTWDEFLCMIKDQYLPADFDHKVEDEIRRTRQTETEKFQEFCVRLELVFMKLSYELSPERKLDYFLHNMRRNYKTPEIARLRTIEALREACRFVDSIDERFAPKRYEKPFVPYSKPVAKVCEVEQAICTEDDEECCETESPENEEDEEAKLVGELQAITRKLRLNQAKNNSTRNCFNCKEPGHGHRECTKPKGVFCFTCGEKDVISTKCPNCIAKRAQKPAEN